MFSDALGRPHRTSRPPQRDPVRIFYNRVPKCGSETLNELSKLLSVENNFTFDHSHEYLDYFISRRKQVRNGYRPIFVILKLNMVHTSLQTFASFAIYKLMAMHQHRLFFYFLTICVFSAVSRSSSTQRTLRCFTIDTCTSKTSQGA